MAVSGWGEGVSAKGAVYLREGGVFLREGVCLPDNLPPVNRMTDRCKNIALRNYVADGNKRV